MRTNIRQHICLWPMDELEWTEACSHNALIHLSPKKVCDCAYRTNMYSKSPAKLDLGWKPDFSLGTLDVSETRDFT